LAAEYDPSDELLVREIRGLKPSAAVLSYIDELRAASFGFHDALERLEDGRIKREAGPRELTGAAVELLSNVAGACAMHLGDDVTLRADASAFALRVADDAGLTLATDDRATRRRAVITDVPLGEPTRRPMLTLRSAVGLGLAGVLDAADELVLDLTAGEVGILVGPAQALTDSLRGELHQRRAGTLRVKNLIAALRLPRGLWREAHRQHLAVWVCLGGSATDFFWGADLSAVEEPDLVDLASDIAGALELTDDRAYRYTRRMEVASVQASGVVVPRGVLAPPLRAADSRRQLDAVHAATLVTTEPLDTLDVLVTPAVGSLRVHYRSLGELHDEKRLVIRRGRRISAERASSEGTVAVMPVELIGDVRFDPIDAEECYPRAVRTEAGDVLFIEKPEPRAWVDPLGGALVASPARILRLTDKAGFGPRLLAAVINHAPAGSEWKSWAVPAVSRAEADRIEAVLAEVEEYQQQARRRVAAADDLIISLIAGLAAGAITLDAQPTTPGITLATNRKEN
jgi:hypothetical protein